MIEQHLKELTDAVKALTIAMTTVADLSAKPSGKPAKTVQAPAAPAPQAQATPAPAAPATAPAPAPATAFPIHNVAPPAAPAPTPAAPAAAPVAAPTVQDVVAKFQALVKMPQHGPAAMKAILTQFGVENVTGLTTKNVPLDQVIAAIDAKAAS